MSSGQNWWQTTTIYQVYPRSFADSNGDGIGDLPGLISRLDTIRDLGFQTIWISPFFASPQADGGYDVSDYCAVAPEYGSLADVERLIGEAHDRNLRVVFDLVMNHTSDQHPWFRQSQQSRDNPKRNWYIWRDGRGNRPPNNWKAMVGGSGWHYHPASRQWYYASFLSFQPDLNYRNPQTRQIMLDIARFWLEKGVDGFRLDIFHVIYKQADFRDNPPSWQYLPGEHGAFFQQPKYTMHQPETFQLARDLRALAAGFPGQPMLLGEVFGPDSLVKRYLGEDGDGLNLIFLWDLVQGKISAALLRRTIRHFEQAYPEPLTPVVVLGNHDVMRLRSRVARVFGRQHALRVCRLLAVFQMTVRGVPVVYNGEEIGMLDSRFANRKAKDPLAKRYGWVPGFLADALGLYLNRDGCRTPMQWDDSPNAGFCPADVAPWLPVHPDYREINLAVQKADADSPLNTYRRLLALRREMPALHQGRMELLGQDAGHVVGYRRRYGEQSVSVMINFGACPARLLDDLQSGKVLYAIGLLNACQSAPEQLPPFSALIVEEK